MNLSFGGLRLNLENAFDQRERLLEHPDVLPKPARLPSAWLGWSLLCLHRYRNWQARASKAYWDTCPSCNEIEGVMSNDANWLFNIDSPSEIVQARHVQRGLRVTFCTAWPENPGFFIAETAGQEMESTDPSDIYYMLRQRHKHFMAFRVSCGMLEGGGLIRPDERAPWYIGEDAFRIHRSASDLRRVLPEFISAWKVPGNRIWLAAAMNDWIAVQELAAKSSNKRLREVAAERAAECMALQVVEVRRLGTSGWVSPGYVLHALRSAGETNLHDFALASCSCPPSIMQVLAFIEEVGDWQWLAVIDQILARLEAMKEPNQVLLRRCAALRDRVSGDSLVL